MGGLGVVVLRQNRALWPAPPPSVGPCQTFYIPDLSSVRKPASGALLLASWGCSGICF